MHVDDLKLQIEKDKYKKIAQKKGEMTEKKWIDLKSYLAQMINIQWPLVGVNLNFCLIGGLLINVIIFHQFC